MEPMTPGLAAAPSGALINPPRAQINIRQVNGGFIVNVNKTLYGLSEEHIATDKQALLDLIEKSI